jgi:hypothetical protein
VGPVHSAPLRDVLGRRRISTSSIEILPVIRLNCMKFDVFTKVEIAMARHWLVTRCSLVDAYFRRISVGMCAITINPEHGGFVFLRKIGAIVQGCTMS